MVWEGGRCSSSGDSFVVLAYGTVQLFRDTTPEIHSFSPSSAKRLLYYTHSVAVPVALRCPSITAFINILCCPSYRNCCLTERREESIPGSQREIQDVLREKLT